MNLSEAIESDLLNPHLHILFEERSPSNVFVTGLGFYKFCKSEIYTTAIEITSFYPNFFPVTHPLKHKHPARCSVGTSMGMLGSGYGVAELRLHLVGD